MNELDYAARVAKGVALLDEKKPGWEHELDLETLDVSSGYSCVTAQLSGSHNWYEGMEQLGLTEGDDGTYVAHGFIAETCGGPHPDDECSRKAAFDTLNTLWKALITTRLAAGQSDG